MSVQSIVVAPDDRLWILDTGSPMFQATRPGGPKLVCVDLASDTVVQTITFGPEVALDTTYLNDVRFDQRKGECGVAYITDSGVAPTARTPQHEGRATGDVPARGRRTGFHGGAARRCRQTGPDGRRRYRDLRRRRAHLVLPAGFRRWYSVSADALAERTVSDSDVAAIVVEEGDKGGASDGLETDDAGRICATSGEHNAILRRLPDGTIETVVHDPRLLWPDTMSVAADGYLYVTANQLYRQAKYSRWTGPAS